MTPTALDLLHLASTRIGRGWTQGAEARAAGGEPTEPWRRDAVCWSLLGTIVAAYEELSRREAGLGLDQLAIAMRRLAQFVDADSLALWNDEPGRTQADVVATLGQAVDAEATGPPLFVYSPN